MLGNPATHIDLDDFAGILRLAGEVDARAGDPDSFHRLIEADPQKAFGYLSSLPVYLRRELAMDLAKSWGARDGARAADAFFHYRDLPRWEVRTWVALAAWAKRDPEAAYEHAISLGEPGGELDAFTAPFLNLLASQDPQTAARLLSTHGDIPPRGMEQSSNVFAIFCRTDPQNALEAAASMPTPAARIMALEGIASQAPRAAQAALQAAEQLPVSQTSMQDLKNAVAYLTLTNPDPYADVDQQTDPYRRQAAMAGVILGKTYNNGLDGFNEAVRRGLSSNDTGWLEAAATLILSPALALDLQDQKSSPDWKSLSPDVGNAVVNYAKAH